MTMKVIIYTDPTTSGLSVMTAAPECPLSLEEIAQKDVPSGVKYRIVDHTDFPPSGREFREAWEADFTTFDGVGA